jgi:hypothetical protein
MGNATNRHPRPRLVDHVVRLFHPKRFPERYTIPIPPGVELRLSKWYLELHRPVFRGTPPAGCTSRTILLHPLTLEWSSRQLDHLIAHELVHVEQFDRWGFFGTYFRYVWGLIRRGYGDNPLEHEARGTFRHRPS